MLGESPVGPLQGIWLFIWSCRKGDVVTGRIRLLGLIAVAAVAVAIVVAACGSSSSSSTSSPAASGGSSSSSSSSSSSASNFKVGLVTDIGGLNDHGFNHLAYVGLTRD